MYHKHVWKNDVYHYYSIVYYLSEIFELEKYILNKWTNLVRETRDKKHFLLVLNFDLSSIDVSEIIFLWNLWIFVGFLNTI